MNVSMNLLKRSSCRKMVIYLEFWNASNVIRNFSINYSLIWMCNNGTTYMYANEMVNKA